MKETTTEQWQRVSIRPIPGTGVSTNTGVLVLGNKSTVTRRTARAETRLSKQGLLSGMRDQEYKALPDGRVEKKYF